jgi:hypothetical protein
MLRAVAVSFLLFALSLNAVADDRAKAEKELRKVAALASDNTARRVVSRVESVMLNTPRADLIMQRRMMNLNYGTLFLVHYLTSSGAKVEEVAAKTSRGQSMYDLANAQHVDWKVVAADAKKLNTNIEKELLEFFARRGDMNELDAKEGYDPINDLFAIDTKDISDHDLEAARDEYQRCKERGAQKRGSAPVGELVEQQYTRYDHMKDQMPNKGVAGANTGAPPPK